MLARFGLSARKSLGQNFLVPGDAADRIARLAGAGPGETVLEIGPGLGALTGALLDRGARVIAVELDARLVEALGELFPDPIREGRLTLLHGDARELDLSALGGGGKLRATGNLPYHLSSPLVRRFSRAGDRLLSAAFTLQREVAERVASPPGSKVYGALSALVQIHAQTEVAMRLPPGAFYPRPGVESAVLTLKLLPLPKAPIPGEELYQATVFAAFATRRKTVLNSLKASRELTVDPAAILPALERTAIDPIRRAETLSVEELAALSRALAEAGARPSS